MDPRNLSVLLALLVVLSVVPSAMAADFEISASDTTPIPERTIDVEDQSFTVDSMVRASPGETVTVDVSAPDEEYQVNVYDKDRNIQDFANAEGDTSVSYDLSGYEPGSYVIATFYDREITAIQPLLVSGYDLSVDAPDTASADDSVEVTVDVTETAASSSPASVTVVAHGDTTQEVDATESNGEYTATFEAGELDDGDYSVYAVAQGDEEVYESDENEILGISDSESMTIESGSSDDGTDENESDESDSNGNESGSNDDTDSNDGTNGDDGSQSNDGSDSSDDSDTSDGGDGAANPPENETTNETATETPSPTPTETVTDTPTETDDVLTPDEEETATESTGASGPGFTAAGALAAVALVALLARRRL